jgi:beta-glucanase (GH16 family)
MVPEIKSQMTSDMKNMIIALLALISVKVASGCSKPGTEAPDAAPSNLVINAVVSTDGSGKVDFTITANNANTFDIEFGDGGVRSIPTGIVSYQYATVGTLTYTVRATARNSAGKSVNATKDISVTVNPKDLVLAWSDEFDKSGSPDPAKWIYDIGTGSNGWGNAELQYYTNRSQNAEVSNGTLKIRAVKESFQGSAYTSARLLTKGKYEFKYGRVEVRAKVPAGVGTWPAIWMMGGDIGSVGWPACGEADIMEHRGSDLNRITSALHYPGRSGGNAVVATTVIQNATTEFHVYRFDWTATSLKFYVDDKLFHEVQNNANIPYNKDFFILLNLAIGGTFGGPVDPAFTGATFEVDYVRVYR